MNSDSAEKNAWVLRSLASHFQKPIDFPEGKQGEKDWRTYGDPWRPFQRCMHQLEDPLAEEIKRHHHTATVLQMGSRSRNFEKPCYLFSGEPLELNGEKIPVELWSRAEFAEHIDMTSYGSKKKIPLHIAKENEERRQKKQKQLEEAWEHTQQMYSPNFKIPTHKELRTMLKLKMKECSHAVSRIVRQKWSLYVSEQIVSLLQGFILKNSPDQTELISSYTTLSQHPVFFDQDSEKEGEIRNTLSSSSNGEENLKEKVLLESIPWLATLFEAISSETLRDRKVAFQE